VLGGAAPFHQEYLPLTGRAFRTRLISSSRCPQQVFEERCEELLPARPRAAAAARRRLAEDLASLLAQARTAMRRIKGLLPQPALEGLKAQRRRLEAALLQLHGGGGGGGEGGAMDAAARAAARVPTAAENRAAREIRCANCQQLAVGAKLCGSCRRVHYCRYAGRVAEGVGVEGEGRCEGWGAGGICLCPVRLRHPLAQQLLPSYPVPLGSCKCWVICCSCNLPPLHTAGRMQWVPTRVAFPVVGRT
jgi:hypothetical protein